MLKIKRTVYDNVPVGLYLVSFESVWSSPCNPGKHECCMEHGCMDNEPNRISDVDATVTKVTRSNYLELPESVCNRETDWNADTSVCGDTHDLRPRLFKLKRDAEAYSQSVVARFRNPQPWECFVKTA